MLAGHSRIRETDVTIFLPPQQHRIEQGNLFPRFGFYENSRHEEVIEELRMKKPGRAPRTPTVEAKAMKLENTERLRLILPWPSAPNLRLARDEFLEGDAVDHSQFV